MSTGEVRGLTPDELVASIRRQGVRTNREMLVTILDDFRAEGLAEDVGGRWRLTPEAEVRLGGAFVALAPPC